MTDSRPSDRRRGPTRRKPAGDHSATPAPGGARSGPRRTRGARKGRTEHRQPQWARKGGYKGATPAERLRDEVEDFVAFVDALSEEKRAKGEAALASVGALAARLWSGAVAVPFGSFSTGLWLPTSDVDVVVRMPDAEPRAGALELLAAELRGEEWVSGPVQVLASASVPVIKVHGEIPLDITFVYGLEEGEPSPHERARELSRQFVEELPELRPLVLVVKALLRARGLNEAYRGGLASYAVLLMAVHFLQRYRVDGGHMGTYLLSFLEYFGSAFNPLECGISTRNGALLPRDAARTGGAWLLVEDPVNDGNNAASSAFGFVAVRAAFEDSFYAMRYHKRSRFAPTALAPFLQ